MPQSFAELLPALPEPIYKYTAEGASKKIETNFCTMFICLKIVEFLTEFLYSVCRCPSWNCHSSRTGSVNQKKVYFRRSSDLAKHSARTCRKRGSFFVEDWRFCSDVTEPRFKKFQSQFCCHWKVPWCVQSNDLSLTQKIYFVYLLNCKIWVYKMFLFLF